MTLQAHGWLDLRDVEAGGADLAGAQRRDQRSLVDDRPARLRRGRITLKSNLLGNYLRGLIH